MKKFVILSIIVLFAIILYEYLEYPFKTYVDRTIKSFTYINNYSTITEIHNNQECYAKISINNVDGDKLLKLYPSKHNYTQKVIAGKVQEQYIQECPNCWYYFNDKSQGQYAYTLCVLSNDKKQLEFYQCFGD